MNKSVINVTAMASKQLSNIMNTNKSKYILFSIEGGGCNGLKYNLEPNNDEPKKIDEIVKIDDFKINVCGKSLLYLLGTTIDYIEEDHIKNIFENKFIFSQPKDISTSCGCGVSFMPKNI